MIINNHDPRGGGRIGPPSFSRRILFVVEGFSVERLMHFRNALDRDVEIVIRKKPRSNRERTFHSLRANFVGGIPCKEFSNRPRCEHQLPHAQSSNQRV